MYENKIKSFEYYIPGKVRNIWASSLAIMLIVIC